MSVIILLRTYHRIGVDVYTLIAIKLNDILISLTDQDNMRIKDNNKFVLVLKEILYEKRL